jgi:hypothetical protein
MPQLPIRRQQFQMQEFCAWLTKMGAEICAPTNPYEVVRYRAYTVRGRKPVVNVVYAKDNGLLTFTRFSHHHYRAFIAGEHVPGMFVSKLDTVAADDPAREAVARKNYSTADRKAKQRADLLARDGSVCWFCGGEMGDDITVEHLVPKSKGGKNALNNYALAHQQCNARAADKPLVEKIALREKLRSQVVS